MARNNFEQAVQHWRDGKAKRARKLLLALIASQPNHADANHLLGVIELQAGKFSLAKRRITRALQLNPGLAVAHNSLGEMYRAQGQLELAAGCYKAALAIAPALDHALNNLGIVLENLGDLEGAARCYRDSIKLAPNAAEPRHNLASTLEGLGRMEEAESCLVAAIALDPRVAGMYNNLGNIRRALGKADDALDGYCQALDLEPDNLGFLANFAEAVRDMRNRHKLDAVRNLIIRCLESPYVDSGAVAPASQSLLRADLAAFLGSKSPFHFGLCEGATRQLLIAHLRCATVTNYDLECLLLSARQAMLEQGADDTIAASGASAAIDVLQAFARQAFLNEYLWHITQNESDKLARLYTSLTAAMGAGEDCSAHQLYLLAAYRPLHKIPGATAWAGSRRSSAEPSFKSILDLLILDPSKEAKIARKIPQLTVIEDRISLAVRAQYEENPYPRWEGMPASRPEPYVRQILKEIHPHRPQLQPTSPSPRILIAGCGTGQHPILVAQAFSQATVLAVDLSRASLAYGKRLADDFKLRNLKFAQADILKLGAIEERFDVIESSGVLHHLQDPEAGLRVLTQLLKPGGFLNLGLYSKRARVHISQLREQISKQIDLSLANIIETRHQLAESKDQAAVTLRNSTDFYTTSTFRDLVLNVQEHQFTILELVELLDRHKLEFLGFVCKAPKVKLAYAKAYPGDRDALELRSWHQFEQDNPHIFANMYQFWCRKPYSV